MKKTQVVTWIDVKDVLPEQGQTVLCVQDPETTATKYPLVGIFNGSRFQCPQPSIYANLEVGVGTWADIIFWMPMPQTPKQLSV